MYLISFLSLTHCKFLEMLTSSLALAQRIKCHISKDTEDESDCVLIMPRTRFRLNSHSIVA